MLEVTAPEPETSTAERNYPSGVIIAENVSAEEYMEKYAGERCEWVRGYVIKMSPASIKHKIIIAFLEHLLSAYFSLNPIGKVIDETFTMRVDKTESRREPDLMVILNDNSGKLHDTYMNGPADICVEVVSPESEARDYGDKFAEYEKGGVREYWIFDPIREEYRFFRLNARGKYKSFFVDANDNYTTPLLPRLTLHVPTLWQSTLPDIIQVVEMVKAMLKEA